MSPCFLGYYRVVIKFGCNWSDIVAFIEFYWILMDFTGFYWISLGFTEFYGVLLGFTGFYWILLWFY